MRYFLLYSLILSAVITSNNTLAATEIENVFTEANLAKTIPIDQSIRYGKLQNGLTYYIKKNTKPEKRMELRLVVKAGAINEDQDQNGVAHFVEHMLFNGTRHFPKNELVNYLEKIGVRFGADLNAYTSDDRTVYQLPIPTDKPQLIHNGLKIISEWASAATFKTEEIEKERGVILEEWRLNQGAGMRASKAHRHALYYGSKLETHDVIGDAEIIKHAPAAAIKRFYQDWYRPELMAVIVVGDINVDAIEKEIHQQFDSLKNPLHSRQLEDKTIAIQNNEKPLISIYTDAEQTATIAHLGFKKPHVTQGSFANYQQQFIYQMWSSMFNERISDRLQQPNPPFQNSAIEYDYFAANTDLFSIVSIPKTEDFLNGYKESLTEAFRAIQQGFTDNEYQRAVQNKLSFLENQYTNRDKLESASFADEYIRHFIDQEAIPGIATEYQYYQQLAQKMSIQEINQQLKNQITDQNWFLTVTAAQKNGLIPPTEKELLSSYQQIKNTDLTPYQAETTPPHLFAKTLNSGDISSSQFVDQLDITEWKLSNGIRVLIKPTHFNDSEILFGAFSQGGQSLMAENEALTTDYATNIIDANGLGELNAIRLSKVLTGKYLTLSPYIDNVSEGFNGSSSPKDIETFLQLLHLYFTAPRKDQDSFNAWMIRKQQSINDSKRNPYTEFSETIRYIMSGNDLHYLPVTVDRLKTIELDKAFQIFQQRFADPSDFTFVFVGAIDIEKFKPLLTQYLGSLATKNTHEQFKDVFHDHPIQGLHQTFYKGLENKSHIVLKMNGAAIYNRQNAYIAHALNELFNQRLTDVLREQKGQVYSPQSSIRLNHYPKMEYVTTISLGCDPKQVNSLIQSVKKIMDDLQTKLATDEELQKLKQIDQRQYEISLKENSTWLDTIIKSEFHQLPLNDILNYPQWIQQLNKNQLKQAAHQYFDVNHLKTFILYPQAWKPTH